MQLNPSITPDEGDRPAWKLGGVDRDIPILFLEGGPLTERGRSNKSYPWVIQAFTPTGYADAVRYFRELAQAATELADKLEQMEEGR